MAFEPREISNQEGAPQFLYEFALNEKRWRYCTGIQAVTLLGQTWAPLPISDSGVRQKGDPTSEILTVTLSSKIDIVRFYMATPPSSPVFVTIRSYHVGDADAVVRYVGEVAAVNIPQPGTAEIACNTLSASMNRNGLRLSWSRTCPHTLYDKGCKANKATFEVPITVDEIGRGTVTSAAFSAYPDGWFNGGFLEWVDSERGVERRAIEEHLGNQVIMFGTSDGIRPGITAKAYPGCNRTVSHCKIKFSNLANYGGCPSMPDESPFDGNPVF